METIKKNWKIKILSVVLAIFFWSFVIVSENPVVTTWVTNIPVVFENIDKLESNNLILTDNPNITVEVKISGQRSNIINITPQHIRVSADFTELSEGDHIIPLNYTLPTGVSLVESPKDVHVKIEKIINKEFPISVVTNGEMPAEYLLESTTTSPEKITLIGARSKLEKVNKIVTNLDLNNLRNNSTVNSEIKAVDADGREVTDIVYGQQFVNINANVYKQKEVDINIKFTGEMPENTRIEKSTLNRTKVFIKGPEEIVDKIQSIDTHDIDRSQIKNSRQIPVNLSLPSDISLVNPDLSYIVDVEVSEKAKKEVKIPANKVEVLVSDDNSASINTPEIVLVIFDYPNELQKIADTDIKLSIDATQDGAGTKAYVPKVYVKNEELDESKIEKVTTVSVTIK